MLERSFSSASEESSESHNSLIAIILYINYLSGSFQIQCSPESAAFKEVQGHSQKSTVCAC